MSALLANLESFFGGLPLPLLETWGRLAYAVGAALAILAFGGFTLRPGGRWGLGRERQAWDANAILSIPVTFSLIVLSGYPGSFVVLVPEAQTLETLKDLAVFCCVVLFGYPALITVPFAYALSDLIEGIPPSFIADWLPGYFMNAACFWMAYQLFGKNPDFRRARTWALYAGFVLAFLAIEPVLWGYLCSAKFSPEISYRHISSALFFTTSLTWVIAPFAMLLLLPLAREAKLFWAEIPGHVKERFVGSKVWAWQAGHGVAPAPVQSAADRWPIRMLILGPFIAVMLLMVGATAFVSLRSAERDANELASHLLEVSSENIELLLDEQLEAGSSADREQTISELLNTLPIARRGQALILNETGRAVGSTVEGADPVAAIALAELGRLRPPTGGLQFRFDHITETPLSRTTWLANVAGYADSSGIRRGWTILTLLPESYYLAGIREGNRRAALIFSVAFVLAVGLAAWLAHAMTSGLCRIVEVTQALAAGDLAQRVPGSHLQELNDLARSFNDMAAKLSGSIEELRANEARMLQTRHFVEILLDSMPGCVTLFDPKRSIFLLWNKPLESLTGYSAAELSRMTPKDLLPPEAAQACFDSLEVVLHKGHDEIEVPVLTKDGRAILHFLKRVRIETDDGPCVLTIGLDISDRRRLEEQFRQSQKMEAVGNLAGGIAHDFNNLLTVILGYAELLQDGLAPGDPKRADLEEIALTAQKAADLTGQLLAFSRKQMLQPVVFDVNQSIRAMEKMLRRVLGEDLILTTQLGEAPARCLADPGQFEQAMLNLVVNARDAMPQGGHLSIRTELSKLREGHPSLQNDRRPGVYVHVSVTDTGSGMSPEIQARIFDPFFTTKAVGKGTGLGLAMVYGMVQQSGGMVEVHSQPGHGSTFDLYFPSTVESAGPGPGSAAVPDHRGKETVLLVEDEYALRDLTEQALRSYGYQVLAAANGAEALDLVQTRGSEIGIVVTDVVMPLQSGPALAEDIQRLAPGLPILFVSGHTDDAVLRHGLLTREIHFLSKPYMQRDLALKVREILDGQAAVQRPDPLQAKSS
jgi:two-component system sensor histidine kinase/response regulator